MIKRLHPQIKLTRVITGRLATGGYPILGLPKRSETGKKIRGLIVAPPGFSVMEFDYSQIELRTAAELSKDKALIHAYKRGEDIHAQTGHHVLGLPPEKSKQTIAQRVSAKTANFSMLMGTSPKGLIENIHRALADEGLPLTWSANCPGCKNFKAEHRFDCDSVKMMDGWFALYKGVRTFMDERRIRATETGRAYGLWGMEWFLPGVWSPHEEVREATLRQSHALPVQEGAQRLIKKAMAVVGRLVSRAVEPILQVHDSLLFIVPTDFVREWYRQVKHAMEHVAKWCVPIVADGSFGPSWLEQEAL